MSNIDEVREINEQIWKIIDTNSSYPFSLSHLLEFYLKMPDSILFSDGIERIRRIHELSVKEKRDENDVSLILSLLNSSIDDRSIKLLKDFRTDVDLINGKPNIFMAKYYLKLTKYKESLEQLHLTNVWGDLDEENLVWVATIYAKQNKWKKAREIALSINTDIYTLEALTNILIIHNDVLNGTDYFNSVDENFSVLPI